MVKQVIRNNEFSRDNWLQRDKEGKRKRVMARPIIGTLDAAVKIIRIVIES